MWQLIFSDLFNIGLGKRNDFCIAGFIFTLFAINLESTSIIAFLVGNPGFATVTGCQSNFTNIIFSMSHTEFPPQSQET